ncbi:MAG: amidohydrolase family protein [Gemmatimonadota bacterium]
MTSFQFAAATRFVFLIAAAQPVVARAQNSIAITGVTVIDGTNRRPVSGTTILVRDGRIAAIGPDGSLAIPKDTRRVSSSGKYVIPGLWDMHVHLSTAGSGALPMLTAYGVTSVRDMGGKLEQVKAWRDAVRAGRMVGPRIMIAGPIIENARWLKRVAGLAVPGLDDLARERIGVETPEDAVRAVNSISKLGVDLIKVRTSPPPAAYTALLEAAKRRGIPVAAHQPSQPTGLRGALVGGIRSIEHIEGLTELDTLPADRRDSLARAIAAAELWFTPTLVASFARFRPDSLIQARAGSDDPGDPYRALVTPELRRFWRQQLDMKKFDSPLDEYRQMVTGGLAGMRRLKEAGVKLLAGTDLSGLLLYPGVSLHEELAQLVDSLGLTPLEAIRSATVEPARFFGMADSLGTIEPGKLADLVILDADPLADIRNTRRIAAVVIGGRVLERIPVPAIRP